MNSKDQSGKPQRYINVGDRIPVGVIEVEEWTWLIMKIAKKMEDFLRKMN